MKKPILFTIAVGMTAGIVNAQEAATPMEKNVVKTEKKEAVLVLSTEKITEKVKKIVVDRLGVAPKEVTLKASFTNDLGADSLDSIELIMEIEKEFKINISDEDAQKINTVGEGIAYLDKRLNIISE